MRSGGEQVSENSARALRGWSVSREAATAGSAGPCAPRWLARFATPVLARMECTRRKNVSSFLARVLECCSRHAAFRDASIARFIFAIHAARRRPPVPNTGSTQCRRKHSQQSHGVLLVNSYSVLELGSRLAQIPASLKLQQIVKQIVAGAKS